MFLEMVPFELSEENMFFIMILILHFYKKVVLLKDVRNMNTFYQKKKKC